MTVAVTVTMIDCGQVGEDYGNQGLAVVLSALQGQAGEVLVKGDAVGCIGFRYHIFKIGLKYHTMIDYTIYISSQS